MTRNRFVFLLGALVALLVAIVVASFTARPAWERLGISFVFLALLVLAAFAISEARRTRYAMFAMTGVAALCRIAAEAYGTDAAAGAFYVAALAVLGTVSMQSVRYLLKSTEVSNDTLAAALCAYGFLVATWAAGFSLLELAQPGAFGYPVAQGITQGMQFGLGDSALALYFSFVTMTTLGYGDIVPATDAARLLAALEAFTGQAYIAILVAKLVGQYAVGRE